jgi:hypothetical protein
MTRGASPVVYIGESGPGLAVNAKMPGIGPRVSLWTPGGEHIASVGDATRESASQFLAPHGVAVDRHGDIYVGEVSRTSMRNKGIVVPPEQHVRCLQKLVKLP